MRPNELEKYKTLQTIIKLLEKKPLSRSQIMYQTGKKKTAVIMALQELRHYKKIYIAEYIMDGCCKLPLYKAGNCKDAPCINKTHGVKLKEVSKTYKKNFPKKPIQPDIHSAWLFNPI
jgi:hypothetical protein